MSVVGRSQQALSGFDPVSLGGCALWLDAADRNTLTLSGSNVTQWRDKSGNGNNATTLSNAPTFSSAAVRFNGTQGFSVGITASSTTESGFFVVGTTGSSSPQTLFGGSASAGGRQLRLETTTNLIQTLSQNTAGVVFTGASLANNTTHLIEFVNNGTTLTHYLNGTTYASGSSVAYSAGQTTTIGLRPAAAGAAEAFNGYIQEILVFSNALTTAQRQAVEGYLAWKWGIPTTPLDIPGCALWLDAADPASMTLSGSNVTQWRDKSGNSNHATAAGNAAVLSSNSILFTGTHGVSSTRFTIADTAALRLTTPFTIYMVYAATALTPTSNNAFGSMVLLGKFPEGSGYPGWNYRARGFNGDLSAIFFNSAANQGDVTVINQNVVDGTRKLIGLNQRTSNTMFTFVNGSADSTITPFALPVSSTDTLILGARNATQTSNTPFNGSVNEIIIHTGSLSREQCQQIETYLARKWGLSLPYSARYPRLPATHPYRLTLPTYRDFSPLDLDGLSLWLDAADQNSLTIVGSNVSQWNDKSGNGYNATQASSANAPVYSTTDRCLQFRSASTQALTIPQGFGTALVGQRYSLIIVGRRRASGFQYFIAGSALVFNGNSNALFGYSGSTTATLDYYGSNVDATVPAYTDPDPIRVLGYESLASQRQIVVNGTVSGTGTAVLLAAYPTPEIGRRYGGTASQIYHDIDVFEMICYVPALSTTQRQQVEAYLARKWGLQSSVLARTTHPYRYGPAVVLPTQISGCALWLDAADATTLTLSGSNVTAWADKSGNGNNATAAGNAAVLSSNSILFTGTHGVSSTRFTIPDTASLRLTTPFTIYMVYTATVVTPTSGNEYATAFLLSKFTDGTPYSGWAYRARGYSSTTPTFVAWFFNSAANQGDFAVTSSNVVDGTRKLVGVNQRTSDTMFSFVNGSADLTLTPRALPVSSTSSLVIGARSTVSPNSEPFNGSVNEIIIHTGSLSRDQCQQIEGYLAWKWGIQSNLPTSNHPFLLYKPVTPTFTPLQLSGLSLWLDAADVNGNGTSLSNGATVSSWVDKSGQGRTMTATTAGTGSVTYSTYGGVGSVLFNSTSSNTAYMRVLNAVNLTSFTVFIIARSQTAVNNQPGLIGIPSASARASYDSIDGFGHYIDSGVGTQDRFFGSGNANVVSNAATSGTDAYPLRLGVWTNSSAGALNSWINGTVGSSNSSGSNRASSASGFGIGFETAAGSSTPINLRCVSQFSEILVYTSVLSATDRQRIEGYLAAKWGLRPSFSPSTNHPYRFGPWLGSPIDFLSSNCVLWLDAADIATITLSGSNVTQWNDKSGNNNHATQATTALAPTYSVTGLNSQRPGLVFTTSYNTDPGATNTPSNFNFMRFPNVQSGTNNASYFAVYQVSDTGPREVFGNYKSQYAVRYEMRTTAAIVSVASTPQLQIIDMSANTTPTLNAFVMTSGTTNTLLAGMNGTYTSNVLTGVTPPASTTDNDPVGHIGVYFETPNFYGNTFKGTISELLIFNSALSAPQRQQIEGYLAWKWGLQSTLPSPSHPYSASPWPGTPLQLSGCALWLDAADATTLTLSGSNVTAWRDKSVNGYSVATYSGTITRTTQNGQGALNFGTGVMKIGSYSWPSYSSMFVVARSATGNFFIVQSRNDNEYLSFLYTGNWNLAQVFDGTSKLALNDSVIAQGTPIVGSNQLFMLAFGYNGGTSSSFYTLNGTSRSTTVASGSGVSNVLTTSQPLYINGRWDNSLDNSVVCEILQFSRSLSSTERQQIEGYLAWKWGLQGNLTSGGTAHPYKSFTP